MNSEEPKCLLTSLSRATSGVKQRQNQKGSLRSDIIYQSKFHPHRSHTLVPLTFWQNIFRITLHYLLVGTRFFARPDRPWGPSSLLKNGYRVFPGGKVRPGHAADHSPPSSAAVMEEYSYTSTHPLGHTGPVTGSLYHLTLHYHAHYASSHTVFHISDTFYAIHSMPMLITNILSNKCTSWYNTHGIYKLLNVSAPRCHHQGVIIHK